MNREELTQAEEAMLREIEEYNQEKEKIREMLGKLGGKNYSKVDSIINIVFLTIILTLFVLEMTTHFLPPFISLEISVLLVSIKIVVMMHHQYKTSHFQFWILNTIEYKINAMHSELRKLEKKVKSFENSLEKNYKNKDE